MPEAAVMGDMIKQTGTHCHAPIHPPAPTPTPMAHPGMPMPLILLVAPTVIISGRPAATKNTMTLPVGPCTAACLPLGMGKIKQGSGTVKIMGQDAGRKDAPTDHPTCKGPIPDTAGGKVMGPGVSTVIIGG